MFFVFDGLKPDFSKIKATFSELVLKVKLTNVDLNNIFIR